MSKIIQEIEKQRMTRKVPEFKPGDTVVVQSACSRPTVPPSATSA